MFKANAEEFKEVDPITAAFGAVSTPEEEEAWVALENSQNKTTEPVKAPEATAITFDNARYDIHRNKSTPTFRP